MNLRTVFKTLSTGFCVMVFFHATNFSSGCEYCSLFNNSFTLDIENADVALIGRTNDLKKFEISRVIKGADRVPDPDNLSIPIVAPNLPVCLVVGSKTEEGSIHWTYQFPLTIYSYGYLRIALQAPKSGPERLAVFWPYLNSADLNVADDAFRQFAKADYEVLRAFKDSMDIETVVEFIEQDKQQFIPEMPDLGYKLLSVCGTAADARIPFQILSDERAAQFKNLEGIIFCYLALAGEAGLSEITERFCKQKNANPQVRVATIRAFSTYMSRCDEIPTQSFFDTYHVLLDHRDGIDFVISEMIRFKDWSAVEKLESIFRSNDIHWLRVECAKYLIASPNEDAKSALERLREINADAVEQAETGIVKLPEPENSLRISKTTNWLLLSWLTSPVLLAVLAGTAIALVLLMTIRIVGRKSKFS